MARVVLYVMIVAMVAMYYTRKASAQEGPTTPPGESEVAVPKCPGANQVWNNCGSACPPTCKDPKPGPCGSVCKKGCECKKGYVRRYDQACVKPYQCGK